jgi:hypothetical protein
MTPAISYIISHYHRPIELKCCLASLALQWDQHHEILVTDSSRDPDCIAECIRICEDFGARRINSKACQHCYESACVGAARAKGKWLCFPCDDSYYVPGFSQIMLQAAEANSWDFVYCDCLYDPRLGGKYSILDAQPIIGRMDKANFLLRRSLFQGFPPHEHEWRDGTLAVSLIQRGVRHGKAPGILCVHN